VLELAELTIYQKRGPDQTESPSIRLHADGKIERLDDWHIGPEAIRADGLVICDGSIGGKIGGADGLPHPEAPQLAEDWKLGSWKLRGKGKKLTLIQADGGRMTVAADGRLDLAQGDEDTGKPGKPEPWGRVEGASTEGLRRTALWVIGLHIGDEQPICWEAGDGD